jgi:hypothetical protein
LDYCLVVIRNVLCLGAVPALTRPNALSARQFGGSRRVEVSSAYPYAAAAGKWTYGDGGSRTVCTAFLVNNCTLATARRCGQGRTGSFQFKASDGQRHQRDDLKFADRLHVDPKDMARGIGGREFYPYRVDHAKRYPCEAIR